MTRTLCLAALLVACQHDPQPASKPAPAATPDPGEQRAVTAGEKLVGTPAPAMTVTTLDGAQLDLAKLYGGKPVYLKFWATWCVPCKAQMPGFEQTFEKLGDQLQVIAVNAGLDDDPAAVRAFRDKFGLRMPIVVDDGRLAAALNLQVTPQHVLIGRDARIAFVGHLDGERLDRAIHDVIAQPASTAVAPAPFALKPAFRPGDAVGALPARDLDGEAIDLGKPGRPRGLIMFDAYCETYLADKLPATAQACQRVREAIQPIATRGDVEWIGVAGNVWTDAGDLTEYRAKHAIKYPLIFDADGALHRAFGVRNVPTVVFVDAQGKVARVVGPDDRDLDAAIRAVARASL